MARRRNDSLPLTLVYALFTILYTWYISRQLGSTGSNKTHYLFYYLGFLFLSVYIYFILQGLILRAKNWGVLLLLPAGILILSVLTGWMIVVLIHSRSDAAAMILVTMIALGSSIFALKWIRR